MKLSRQQQRYHLRRFNDMPYRTRQMMFEHGRVDRGQLRLFRLLWHLLIFVRYGCDLGTSLKLAWRFSGAR